VNLKDNMERPFRPYLWLFRPHSYKFALFLKNVQRRCANDRVGWPEGSFANSHGCSPPADMLVKWTEARRVAGTRSVHRKRTARRAMLLEK